MSGQNITYTLAAGNASGYSTTVTGSIFKRLLDNKAEIAPQVVSENVPDNEVTFKHPITGRKMTKVEWDEMQDYVENQLNMKRGGGGHDNYSREREMTEEVETIKVRTKNLDRER